MINFSFFKQSVRRKTLSLFGRNRYHDWVIIFFLLVAALVGFFLYAYLLWANTMAVLTSPQTDMINRKRLSSEEVNELFKAEQPRELDARVLVDPAL
jgi:hypothetical protein